ncbi:ADP-ribose glycohydrolase MACROD1 isoform X2 [Hoplias malabaricus]|uniref:ADP-ribose glycohydrolase MACROD1 isoform X2 n=1 Tax=Hoplias malabaricus TaxID=27720 RepID=UPI00346292B1
MAFQLSKLTARLSLPKYCLQITENNFPRSLNSSRISVTYFPGSWYHTVSRSGVASLNITRVLNSYQRVINTVQRVEKFSSTSATAKSFEWLGIGAWRRVGKFSAPVALLLGLSATVAASSVHSGVLCAMAAQSGSDSETENTDWKKAKKEFLSMSLDERRKVYKTYVTLEDIPIWDDNAAASEEPLYKVDEELNKKISLFKGDITKLEIDAIANAANKSLLGGGGVDGAIHRGAGPMLKKECSTLGGCETGEAKITGAYRLPAKYVIHTVGPIAHGSVGEKEEQALKDCYFNCLHTATENKLRTVAFPCISTGVYGYPPEQAVEVALKTVREYLEKHHAQMDRVIFCVFLKSDEELYKNRLPAYFAKAG